MNNVTRVIARYTAPTIDICRSGSVVALHLNTPTGRVVVTTSERAFVTSARGAVDANKNPFRTLDEINALKGERT